MSFREKLQMAARANKSWLCVGLDPEISKIPAQFGNKPCAILDFNKAIIESTSDLVCAYKPNAAFYESHGAEGWDILHKSIELIPKDIPVILDFKRGDIGNTAKMYARSAFEYLRADAVTISPYLGYDSVAPFLEYEEKGIFILCLTSNPSSSDLQKLRILESEQTAFSKTEETSQPFFLYQYLAKLASKWDSRRNIGLVVGATSPDQLGIVRKIVGNEMPILIPGVGSQGGDLGNSMINGSNNHGEMAIVNVARAIIYPEISGNFQDNVRDLTLEYREQMSIAIGQKDSKIK